MPFPTAAVIGAGASLIGQGANAISQGSMNRKTRQFTLDMYNRQRADSLSDYNMQNEYNSPQAMMKRLKDAKINPNSLFGQSQEAAAPVRTSSVESWNPQAPQFDVPSAINTGLAAHYDVALKQAQTDNVKQATTVAAQDEIMKAAQTLRINAETKNIGIQTEKGAIDLKYADMLSQISVEAAKANLQNTIANTSRTVQSTSIDMQKNIREAVAQSQSIKESVARITTMAVQNAKTRQEGDKIRQEIQNLKLDEKLKQLEYNLRRTGVQPGDALWQRAAVQAITGMFAGSDNPNLKDIFGSKKAYDPNYGWDGKYHGKKP
ncbi:MAG: DNA pilot protein [Microviridae sp.]|nr:MAG: DNA pilot protein [Microviridae sp.]